MKIIKIGKRLIGKAHPTFIIAEIGQAHDGSLGIAHAYIDALADTGVDAVKFQTHIAQFESTLNEPFRINFSPQDKNRYNYWKRMEFSEEQWRVLKRHAIKRGLIFLSSAFSLRAVDMLKRIGMPAWKVGSGEFKSKELMEAMGKTGSPIIYSTGMSSSVEVKEAVAWFKKKRFSFALCQATSCYPTPFEKVGLNILDEFRNKFSCPVGLSDHSGSIFPGLAALARGVNLLEVHVTFDKKLFGPDTLSSLTMQEVKLLSDARRAFIIMDTHPVNKDVMAKTLLPMRNLFSKSITTAVDLPAGTIIKKSLLTAKKPGTGIPYSEKEKLIGRKLIRNVKASRLLEWSDIN